MTSVVTRRRLLLGLGVASMTLVAACGAAPASPTAAPAKPAATAAPAAAKPATTGGEAVELKWWTHGAEEENKKKMLNLLVKNFEDKNPNVKVTITWTQMPGIWQALQASFTADSGYPDIYWFGLSQKQWVQAGWVADLTNGINWENMAPWAKQAATLPGPDGKPGVYFITEFASTGEIYYNKQIFSDNSIAVPANGQYTQEQFKEVVRTVTGKGLAAFANANGDRDYPGAIPMTYFLLSALGPGDLVKL